MKKLNGYEKVRIKKEIFRLTSTTRKRTPSRIKTISKLNKQLSESGKIKD